MGGTNRKHYIQAMQGQWEWLSMVVLQQLLPCSKQWHEMMAMVPASSIKGVGRWQQQHNYGIA